MIPGEPTRFAPQRFIPAVLLMLFAATAAGASPVPVLDVANAIGPTVSGPGRPIETITVALTDTFEFSRPPRDTIPRRSRLEFAWHGDPNPWVEGYRYRLYRVDRLPPPPLTDVDSTVHSVSFPHDTLTSGNWVFELRTVDRAGFERGITRYFHDNFSPDTWLSGPDLALLDERFGWTGSPRSLSIANWNALPDLSGTPLSCDTLTQRPAERAERKTFFEIYENRLHVRAEFDTVHMNSWVILSGGGSDLDSPYDVKVGYGDPDLADTMACLPGPLNTVHSDGLVGSPIGFKSQWTNFLSPDGPASTPSQSVPFPNYDIYSVFRLPAINAYLGMRAAGKVYAVLRSQDGDGGADSRIPNPRALVEAVDNGLGTPEQIAQRHKVLVFFVDQPAFLRFDDPGFAPQPGQVFTTRSLEVHLLADDSDPFDLFTAPPNVGGPSTQKVLRWNLALTGTDGMGEPVSYSPFASPVFSPHHVIDLPASFVDPQVTFHVELCDCNDCEGQPGSGRCVQYAIPVTVPQGVTTDVETPEPFALAGVHPNPASRRDLTVQFSLAPGSPARLELLDVTGRRRLMRDLSEFGPGSHSVRLAAANIQAGIYFVRLVQGRDVRVVRAAVLE